VVYRWYLQVDTYEARPFIGGKVASLMHGGLTGCHLAEVPSSYTGNILQVDIYEARPFIGGKVASFQDKDGNHIELGLHVFFGCYNNLFRLMNKASTQITVTHIGTVTQGALTQ